jgi:hypothetical protein
VISIFAGCLAFLTVTGVNMKITDGREKDSCPVHPRTYDTITKVVRNVWLSHLYSERVQCTRSWIQKTTFTLVKSKRTLLKLSVCTTSSTIRKLQTTKDKFHPSEFYMFVQYMDRPSSGDRSTSSCSKTWSSCTRSSTMTVTLTDDFVTRLPLIWRQSPVQTNNTLLPTRSTVFSCLLLLSARLPRCLHPPGRLSSLLPGLKTVGCVTSAGSLTGVLFLLTGCRRDWWCP